MERARECEREKERAKRAAQKPSQTQNETNTWEKSASQLFVLRPTSLSLSSLPFHIIKLYVWYVYLCAAYMWQVYMYVLVNENGTYGSHNVSVLQMRLTPHPTFAMAQRRWEMTQMKFRFYKIIMSRASGLWTGNAPSACIQACKLIERISRPEKIGYTNVCRAPNDRKCSNFSFFLVRFQIQFDNILWRFLPLSFVQKYNFCSIGLKRHSQHHRRFNSPQIFNTHKTINVPDIGMHLFSQTQRILYATYVFPTWCTMVGKLADKWYQQQDAVSGHSIRWEITIHIIMIYDCKYSSPPYPRSHYRFHQFQKLSRPRQRHLRIVSIVGLLWKAVLFYSMR